MILLAIITVYPFLYVLAVSLNDPFDTIKGGIVLLPRVFTLDNYKEIFNYPLIGQATLISTLRTVIGTVTSDTIYSDGSLCSQQKRFFCPTKPHRFVCDNYVCRRRDWCPSSFSSEAWGLMNNFLVYILPGLINPFNLIVIESFY